MYYLWDKEIHLDLYILDKCWLIGCRCMTTSLKNGAI